ncbi:hypothetical protein, partial [Rheinheimera sp.]|uniref:hypothetical protein n=1 Tax=Rheinheimera sp. TaxID=1869214 RepID=UPI0040486BE4
MLNYKIKDIRHPQYGNQLLPLLINVRNNYYPEPSAALWGWSLWLANPLNTVRSRLQDLCIFYEWVEREYPTFFEDAAKLKLMTMRKANDLISFLLVNFKYNLEDGVQASHSTFNRRIDSTKLFLDYHYSRYIDKLNNIDVADNVTKKVAKLCTHIGKARYTKAALENQTRYTEPLSLHQIDIIREIVRPSADGFLNESNPFRKALQRRNACIVLLLCELGCRASELMLIRHNQQDLKLTTNPTVIIQKQDINAPEHRGRRDRASHKTLGRELPISRGLADLLIDYIELDRPALRKLFNGQLTEYLFVSDKDGGAMTTDGLEYVLKSLYRKVPVRRQLMWTPHVSTINNSLEEIIAYLCTSS